jgi:hypothetical protein
MARQQNQQLIWIAKFRTKSKLTKDSPRKIEGESSSRGQPQRIVE